MNINTKLILNALVGSQAHGLAHENSDFDYRGVFIHPTSALLKIGGDTKQTSWQEGQDDRTSWELRHFLELATKCNPTILETLMSSVYEADAWGEELRALFPHLWNSAGVYNAFVGYGLAQQKKFLMDHDKRRNKYATAYVRTLYNAWELLSTGSFHVDIRGTEIESACRRFRAGEYTIGEVIQTCSDWQERVKVAYEQCGIKATNFEPINDFLLRVRKEYW